eukprot:TRINITY_DN25417_c0_g1_i1.p1 TRINITY_DN25417_c0_g1~~TRINITY_DN25417_c0_g1_i1.p1  ORF type:complete len:357 (+),score=63.93 TRINITY_DN25417_c0_g1_i1:67-1137(+)
MAVLKPHRPATNRSSAGLGAAVAVAVALGIAPCWLGEGSPKKAAEQPSRRLLLAGIAQLSAVAKRADAELAVQSKTDKHLVDRLLAETSLLNPRRGSIPGSTEKPNAYPSWLFGEWEVRSKPRAFAEPLGPRFVDAETRAALREDFAIGKELVWRSRFYWAALDETGTPKRRQRTSASDWALTVRAPAQADPPGVVQYRAFNAAQEVRAFLGQTEAQVIADADPREQPLQVLVAFPVQEGDEEAVRTVRLQLASAYSERAGTNFTSSELFRQVVLTEGEVDTVGDFEVLNSYHLVDPDRIVVRNRVAKYLVPGDPLFDEAADAAVSYTDYDWDMRRLGNCVDTPYGEQCLQVPRVL